MSAAPIAIPPRRSLICYAILAILTVFASYVFVVQLALACAILPVLALAATLSEHMNFFFQLLILSLGGIFVACTLLYSLVPTRDEFVAPGPLLERTVHPRLFAELDQIATSLNETLPGEVYLIGAANAFVANRGGILGFGSRRVMALGLPLLAALTVSEMRAVLAHEFGHYYGGDTRLIPWVYKAQKAIVRALENVGSIQDGFQNGILQVLFTLVFGILKGTFGVFLRVVNFISRKQEFRADELACIVAGASSHEQGLRKVHSATMAWPSYWQTEVVPVLGRGCAPEIGDGFCRYLKAPLIAGQVSQLLEKELSEGKTAPFDSHPPLRERLNAIDQLQMDTRPQDTRAASTLLDTAQTAEEQFLRFLNPEFPEAGLRVVTWDNVGQEVMIPAWKSTVSQYAMIFSDVTPELLPDLMPKLGQLAAKVRDPVGRILTGQERLQTVATILGIGVQLALLANGWELVNLPGVFYLKRGEETIVPENEVIAVLSGKTSRDAWVARCAELGITHVALASLGERPAA